jgi:hypothetical protein
VPVAKSGSGKEVVAVQAVRETLLRAELLLHRQFVAAEVWCGAEDVVAMLLQLTVLPLYPLSLYIRLRCKSCRTRSRQLPFVVARAVVQRVVAVQRVRPPTKPPGHRRCRRQLKFSRSARLIARWSTLLLMRRVVQVQLNKLYSWRARAHFFFTCRSRQQQRQQHIPRWQPA